MEDKLNQAHLEVQQLKASVKNYEGMIDNYKSQVDTLGGLIPYSSLLTARPLGWGEMGGGGSAKSIHCGFVP